MFPRDRNVPSSADWTGGRAELIEDRDKVLPHQLSHKYLGVDPPAESDDETRLIVRIVPEKVITFSP